MSMIEPMATFVLHLPGGLPSADVAAAELAAP